MSRAPLKRPCESPAEAYEREREDREADRKKLEQITRDSANTKTELGRVLSRLGDEQQLRGIPAIARGVTGAMHGTRPG